MPVPFQIKKHLRKWTEMVEEQSGGGGGAHAKALLLRVGNPNPPTTMKRSDNDVEEAELREKLEQADQIPVRLRLIFLIYASLNLDCEFQINVSKNKSPKL